VRKKSIWFALLALVVGALALTAAGCGDDGGSSGTEASGGTEGTSGGSLEALPSSSCTDMQQGDNPGDVLIASDLPLQGSSRTQTVQMNKAIVQVLEQNNWKAGDLNIAFQECDDATAAAGKWDSAKCSTNAGLYANNPGVVGVIGTFNSGCAAIIIPVLNQAPGGGLAMISPANTYVCLTTAGPGCEKTEPDKYYPSGTRNYARVVAHDAYQGAAAAQFMKDQGVTNVYVLNDKEAYGLGVAQNFRNAAKALGLGIAGFEAWDGKATSYEGLMTKVKQSGADALFLGGLIDENGGQLIKDKVKVLGPNTGGDVLLFAPDGFTTQATIDEAGQKNAEGMFASVAGVPPDQLTGAGKDFVASFQADLGSEPIEPYSAYGAQAAQVLLDAIATAGNDRAAIIQALFATKVTGGILGDFEITPDGDPTAGPITVYKAGAQFDPETVITPEQSLVESAMGGR
jgi:branched-chain amino acid transport system substrate-binding protein